MLGRHPGRNDVVVNLVVGRDLDELYHSPAPLTDGLDPDTGAALVSHAVEVMVKDAVALQKAEATRVLVGEGRGHRPRRIVERPPDPLARPAPHAQSVRIVNFRAPVDGVRFGLLRVPVHRGQGRDAQAVDVAAQMDLLLDVHGHGLVAPHEEAKRTRDARAVEQSVNGHLAGAIRWGLDVDIREIRKLLGHAGHGGIDRDATRRDTVLIIGPDGPEIGGTEKSDPVVLAPVERLATPPRMAIPALLEAESGEACAFRQFARESVGGHVEIFGPVDDLLRFAVNHDMHVHRFLEILAEVKERHRKLARALREQRVLGLVA